MSYPNSSWLIAEEYSIESLMKFPPSDSKMNMYTGKNLPLPAPLEFQLNSLISSTILPNNISAKGSLNKSTEEYQKDLRKELKRALSYEQRLQHKNIRVMKLSGELATRHEKSRKAMTRVPTKDASHSKSTSSIKENISALQDLETRFSRTSEFAHNTLLKLLRHTNQNNATRKIIQEHSLLNQYLSSASEAKTLTNNQAPGTDASQPFNKLQCENEFEPEDFQSIMESNIAIYREGITRKHSQNSVINDCHSQTLHSEGNGNAPTTLTEHFLVRKASLKTLTNPKSPATVFETNLNSLHKKLRINPHPLAIYNDSHQIDLLSSSDYIQGKFTTSRGMQLKNLQYVDQEVLTPSDSTSEELYLKLLQLSEGPIPRTLLDPMAKEENDEARGSRSLFTLKHASSKSALRSKSGRGEENPFSFLPVQKHSPLHHTHRPTQSILKKTRSRYQGGTDLRGSRTEEICEEAAKSQEGPVDLSISPVLANGCFITRSEGSAPILSAITDNAPTQEN